MSSPFSQFKSLLISINNTWRYSNTGIDQLAGCLRKNGFFIDILYLHERFSCEKILSKIKESYDLFGFSVTSANYENCINTATQIRSLYPRSKIVFGGGFATRYYREIFNSSEIVDYIILGDGEIPLMQLIVGLKENDLTGVEPAFLAQKDNVNNKVPYCNQKINYLPAFDYYLNETKTRNARKEHCVQTKNNICTGNCSFCTERKGNVVFKEIEQIIAEIKYVAQNFGVKKFFFTDDNLFDPNTLEAKKRVRDLCLEIKKLPFNLVFKCYSKAISLQDNKLDNELLALMFKTGFRTIFIGLEAGNEQDLILYNKKTTVKDNLTAIGLLKRHKIVPQVGFINFNPYSSLETLRLNYDFMMKIGLNNLFQYICSYLRVFKYTAIYDRMKKDGLLLENYDYMDEKSLYEFENKNVKDLFMFAYNHMYSRIRGLDIELDWMLSFYEECKKINPVAKKFEDEILALQQIQFEKIREFFYLFLVKNDIDSCAGQVNNFLGYFEGIQPRLLEIHRDLVDLYVSNAVKGY